MFSRLFYNLLNFSPFCGRFWHYFDLRAQGVWQGGSLRYLSDRPEITAIMWPHITLTGHHPRIPHQTFSTKWIPVRSHFWTYPILGLATIIVVVVLADHTVAIIVAAGVVDDELRGSTVHVQKQWTIGRRIRRVRAQWALKWKPKKKKPKKNQNRSMWS